MKIRPFHPARAGVDFIEDCLLGRLSRKKHRDLVAIGLQRPVEHDWSTPLDVPDAAVAMPGSAGDDNRLDVTNPESKPNHRVTSFMDTHGPSLRLVECGNGRHNREEVGTRNWSLLLPSDASCVPGELTQRSA